MRGLAQCKTLLLCSGAVTAAACAPAFGGPLRELTGSIIHKNWTVTQEVQCEKENVIFIMILMDLRILLVKRVADGWMASTVGTTFDGYR